MGNQQQPSSNVTLEHFQQTFPSLAYYIPDVHTFQEIHDLVSTTCEFLESRNMDCKDRVYTKRVKEMQVRLKEIIKKRANIIIKQSTHSDMILDYFSYACIYGTDVAQSEQGMEDWTKLVKDIPERVLKNHMMIQQELERNNSNIKKGYLEVAEEESRKQGWDNLAQMEYFSNIDKYENLSFVGETPAPTSIGKPSKTIENQSSTQLASSNKKTSTQKISKKSIAQTMVLQDGMEVYDLSDDDLACEDGASPALLGGFCVQSEIMNNPEAANAIIPDTEHPERLAEDLQDERLFDKDASEEEDIVRCQGKRKRTDRFGLPTGRESSEEFETLTYKRQK